MSKITDYSEVSALLAANVFLIDGAAGTKKITAQNVATGIAGLMQNEALFAMLDEIAAPEMHRMIFRGKNLGTSITAEQKAQIQAGTFKGLWLGDYWTINNVIYRIVDFDYWLNSSDGDTAHSIAYDRHHIVVMPDHVLYNAQMNESNVTTGGYIGSKMYTTNLESAKTTLTAAFGTALLTHRNYFVNAITNGKASAGAWYDSTVDLPNEIMMYGHSHFLPGCDGSTVPAIYTIDKTQLALMAVCPKFINPYRENQWLRDVVSGASFARVHAGGGPNDGGASSSLGVRPAVAVG